MKEYLFVSIECLDLYNKCSSIPFNGFQLRTVREQDSPIYVGNNTWTTLNYATIPPPISSVITISFFSIFKSLFVFLLSLFLKFPRWMKSYDSYLSLTDTSFSIIPSRSMHIVTNGKISLFLWLSNIPLSVWCVCVCDISCVLTMYILYIQYVNINTLLYNGPNKESNGKSKHASKQKKKKHNILKYIWCSKSIC